MTDHTKSLAAVRARITRAEHQFGRAPGSVTLLAVSKGCTAADIRAVAAAGQHHFGESYLNEALPKIEALADLGLTWHFIGPVQSNKTRGIAACFDWVHGIDRFRVARRLSEQRPPALAPLQGCVQINIGGDPGKSGIDPVEAAELVRQVSALPRLTLRGLMTIPAQGSDMETQRGAYVRLREIRDDLTAHGFKLDTLSMGMSDDVEAAIAAGTTMVRVGTAIFGPRA